MHWSFHQRFLENRLYFPVGLTDRRSVVHNKAFAPYDAPLWNMAIVSRLHWLDFGTVCA
ncbi:MAG: type IIL restriction-modification enzyme MmeI [Bdellovibrionota bacterium]